MLAANLPLLSQGRGWLLGRGGRRPRCVPPQTQVQGLLGEQRLDQAQVQAPNAAAIQHQDLISWTQTWENSSALQRGGGVNGGGWRLFHQGETFSKSQPIWKNFVDKNPAVFLAVNVSCYRKALWETRQTHEKQLKRTSRSPQG